MRGYGATFRRAALLDTDSSATSSDDGAAPEATRSSGTCDRGAPEGTAASPQRQQPEEPQSSVAVPPQQRQEGQSRGRAGEGGSGQKGSTPKHGCFAREPAATAAKFCGLSGDVLSVSAAGVCRVRGCDAPTPARKSICPEHYADPWSQIEDE